MAKNNARSKQKASRPVPVRGIALSDDERAELEQLRAERENRYYLKVSDKGGVSLYGVRRFPITLYDDEWDVIDRMADEIRAFRERHRSQLTRKRA